MSITIRPETTQDVAWIRALNEAAFDTLAEAQLVELLRRSDAFIPELSLVAFANDQIVGHVLFTHAVVVTATAEVPVLALGPMAVIPELQRRGIGSRLVRQGLSVASMLQHQLVIVLGHPEFYPRFGFERASRYRICAPFDVPDEVFMSLWLGGSVPRSLDGVVRYAEPFNTVT